MAPGEVTELPVEVEPPAARRLVYTDRQVKHIPHGQDIGQIQIHPVQYQLQQPENPEVVVVDDTDINVDGESTRETFR